MEAIGNTSHEECQSRGICYYLELGQLTTGFVTGQALGPSY